MQNRYFSDHDLEVLTRPERWALVTPWFPRELPGVTNARHAAWMLRHTHAHPHLEMLMTLRGGGYQGFADQVYLRRPGAVFLFDAFTRHDYYLPPWATGETQLWIHLMESRVTFSVITVQEHETELQTNFHRDFGVEELGLTRCSLPVESTLPAAAGRMQCIGLLGMLLSAVIRAGYEDEEEESRDQFQRRVIYAVQQHLRETAGNGITLEGLAHFAGYSKYHFHRLFKRYTGMTVHAYIDQCRIEKVRALHATGMAQKEMAETLGFSSLSAFSHWTRKVKLGTRG